MIIQLIYRWSMLVMMIASLSCKEVIPSPGIPPFPCYTNCDSIQPDIIWKILIAEEDNEESISTYPEIADSIIIFSNKFYKGQPEIFKGFNRYTGKLKWIWAFPHSEGGENYIASSNHNTIVYKGQYFLSIATFYYNINPQEGSVNAWVRRLEMAQSARIQMFSDYVYFSFRPWPPERGRSYIARSKLDFSAVDTIVKMVKTDPGEWDPKFTTEIPTFYIHPEGDTLAFYAVRGYTPPYIGWMEVYLMNLSKSGYPELWKHDSLPWDTNCNVVADPIFYRDSILIFPGQNAVYGFNIADGEILYSTLIEEDLLTTDFRIFDDNLIFVDNPGNLHILDPLTGVIKAIVPDCGGNVSNIEYHNGIAYFTSAGSGKLYAVDIEKRERIYEWTSPHRRERGFAQFSFAGVAIDTANGYLYTSDRVYAMCLNLVN